MSLSHQEIMEDVYNKLDLQGGGGHLVAVL